MTLQELALILDAAVAAYEDTYQQSTPGFWKSELHTVLVAMRDSAVALAEHPS